MSSADLNKISDYQNIFMGFCDVYQLPIQPSRNKAVDTIISNPQSNFKFYTQFSRLFEAFKDFINNKIDLEQFMSIGDLEQKSVYPLNRTISLYNKPNIDSNTIIIVDKVLTTLYPLIKNEHSVIEL